MSGWSEQGKPAKDAVWVERARLDGPATEVNGLAQLRHPGHAWLEILQPPPEGRAQAQAAAGRYLEALCEWAPELAAVLRSLRQPKAAFGWLPLRWGLDEGLPDDVNPLASFLLPRGHPRRWQEASLVLLAARRLNGQALGDGVGLRATAHVWRPQAQGPWQLRFASLVASRLHLADEPLPLGQAVAATAPNRPQQSEMASQKLAPRRALRAAAAEPCASSLQALQLFERDPASMGPPETLDQRRPSHSDAELNAYREYRVEVPAAVRRVGPLPLQEDQGLFFVSHESRPDTGQPGAASVAADQSTAVLPSLRGQGQDPMAFLPLRSDNLAAAQAYLRGKEFFDRLQAYGLHPAHYFRHAQLPLELQTRARLPGAPDGCTLNAEVRPVFGPAPPEQAWPADASKAAGYPALNDDPRPHLQMRLGSADTRVRLGEQTLGLAADPRWAWHEWGHVLSFAATGELEFAFSHGAGDALAAITADPDSGLAADPAWRGFTFPWAFVPRRHDRLALQGYGWCGARCQLRLQARAPRGAYRHGYFEGELLSSSLFRLYLILGGATGPGAANPAQAQAAVQALAPEQPPANTAVQQAELGEPGLPGETIASDLSVRRSAADFCVYLIIRAIGLLGPNGVAPAQSVDQFVGALIDADLGTGLWQVQAPWPYREGRLRTLQRQGGRAHKVIRWAFEQQGLYATNEPGAVAEGLGLPPPEDVYIADRRDGEAGGYAPMPWRWHPEGQGSWYAGDQAIVRGPSGPGGLRTALTVRAGQRGRHPARAIHLRLWVSPASPAGLQWQEVQGVQATGPGCFTATLPAALALQPVWLLAAVDATADLSLLPAGAAPPADRSELMELVACDNNLGLAYRC